jgi:hypothetical protein
MFVCLTTGPAELNMRMFTHSTTGPALARRGRVPGGRVGLRRRGRGRPRHGTRLYFILDRLPYCSLCVRPPGARSFSRCPPAPPLCSARFAAVAPAHACVYDTPNFPFAHGALHCTVLPCVVGNHDYPHTKGARGATRWGRTQVLRSQLTSPHSRRYCSPGGCGCNRIRRVFHRDTGALSAADFAPPNLSHEHIPDSSWPVLPSSRSRTVRLPPSRGGAVSCARIIARTHVAPWLPTAGARRSTHANRTAWTATV